MTFNKNHAFGKINFTKQKNNCKLTQLAVARLGEFMKKYQCIVCGWIYDEALGCPEEGLAPGTRWEDIPDDWICPECGVGKMDFEMVEI